MEMLSWQTSSEQRPVQIIHIRNGPAHPQLVTANLLYFTDILFFSKQNSAIFIILHRHTFLHHISFSNIYPRFFKNESLNFSSFTINTSSHSLKLLFWQNDLHLLGFFVGVSRTTFLIGLTSL